MNIKKMFRISGLSVLIISVLFLVRLEGSKDLVASLAQLPGLADSPDKGAFVDVVIAMGELYKEGKIKIELYPFARSINNVIEGKADFHVPGIRNVNIDQSKKPYSMVTEKMGTVHFVIYSNTSKQITKAMLDKAIDNAKSKKGKFPYKIEIPAGIEDQFPFPYISENNVELGLKKVEAKRIDALVWAQEEVDLTLKKLKIKNIRREFWMGFEDVIIISKDPKGVKMNIILSDLLKKLKASGKMQAIYSKVHNPYVDWQPAKMGW